MSDTTDSQLQYDEESRRLLLARTRVGLWMLIPFMGFFALIDRLFVHRPASRRRSRRRVASR